LQKVNKLHTFAKQNQNTRQMKRDSIIFYRCELDAADQMADADALQFLRGVLRYALDGTEPELSGLPAVAFTLIRPQHDANNQRFSNGQKGGRPKKTNGYETEKPVVSELKTEGNTSGKPNVNVNVNVNDNVNNNVNENVCVFSLGEQEKKQIFIRFFFRNMMEPNKEVNRFADWGDSVGWINKNGQKIADKVKYSRFWTPQTEGKRFPAQALGILSKAHAQALKAGDQKAADLVFSFVSGIWTGQGYQLRSIAPDLSAVLPFLNSATPEGVKLEILTKKGA